MNLSKFAALFPVFAAVIIGCGDDASSLFQPNVVNQPDTFAVQANGLKNVSATEIYTWQNPGATADVGQSGIVISGNAVLTVLDADDVTVYTSNLTDTGTFSTTAGVSGVWTVRLVLTNVSGDIDFSLQTP